jgi:galactoside O-acetyltransferase
LVILKKHVVIGTGSTILPGVILGEGVSVGAMSLVNKNLDDWCIYVGNPVKLLGRRQKNKLLEFEQELLAKNKK